MINVEEWTQPLQSTEAQRFTSDQVVTPSARSNNHPNRRTSHWTETEVMQSSVRRGKRDSTNRLQTSEIRHFNATAQLRCEMMATYVIFVRALTCVHTHFLLFEQIYCL